MLPVEDRKYLETRFPGFSETTEQQMICVVLPDFALPDGLNCSRSDLLLRLAPGYPDVPPDMWWFNPPVTRGDGNAFPRTNVQETHLGRDWQRWSRHLDSAQWHSGIDDIETYLALVRGELTS